MSPFIWAISSGVTEPGGNRIAPFVITVSIRGAYTTRPLTRTTRISPRPVLVPTSNFVFPKSLNSTRIVPSVLVEILRISFSVTSGKF